MTSAGRSIAEASASRDQTGAWVVNYRMTKRGSALWDKVAKENFHKLLGVDFHGKVVSALLIQPSQTSFTSFDGQGTIAGNFTKAQATALARALHHD
jgi:preprotein translocase subunit SecD